MAALPDPVNIPLIVIGRDGGDDVDDGWHSSPGRTWR
jgi:hypothetical protein